jgi:hypothetical protein
MHLSSRSKKLAQPFTTMRRIDPDNPTDAEIAAAVQARSAVAQPVASLVTVEIVLDEMIRNLAPLPGFACKRYLRRSCCKPADMPIRAYVSHFMRINTKNSSCCRLYGGQQT